MNNVTLALDGAWKVLVTSLLLGAGLPIIFALGVRARAFAAGGDAEAHGGRPRPAGNLLAVVCFVLVLLGIALGITIIVASGFGKAVSFQHIYPTIVSK
ncbi:MAG TPA: hypothetical protein VNS83_03145 [Lapillicoccus sp.]|nr:hypothetical protein [Lapillicoccus sp.]